MELLNRIIWSIAISFILVNSIYYSLKLKFPQFRIIKIINSIKKSKVSSNISPLDTLIITLSSKIGVGSLAGIAIAIKFAGVGTIFWIWFSSLFLSIITYIENVLSIIYKENGNSGPSYYIKKGLNNNKLSIIYSVLIIVLYIILFSSIQNNTITTLFYETYKIKPIIITLMITMFATIIITKGIKTISKFCNRIFPIMMAVFLLLGLIVIIININNVPYLIGQIIREAFSKNSISGGIVYTIIISLQKSIFANESGVGTSAIASGATSSNDYMLQGNLGIIQNYFINFVVLTTTTLIIGLAKINNLSINNGIELTKYAFHYHFGTFGETLLLLIVLLFSFSTIITIYYYGESALKSVSNKRKYRALLKTITLASLFVGGLINAGIIWDFIDLLLAITTIINMYAIYKFKNKIVSKLQKK